MQISTAEIPWSRGCTSDAGFGGKNIVSKLVNDLEIIWVDILSMYKIILLLCFFIFIWELKSRSYFVEINKFIPAFLLCFHDTGRFSTLVLFLLKV